MTTTTPKQEQEILAAFEHWQNAPRKYDEFGVAYANFRAGYKAARASTPPVSDAGQIDKAKDSAMYVFKDSCNHTHDAIEYMGEILRANSAAPPALPASEPVLCSHEWKKLLLDGEFILTICRLCRATHLPVPASEPYPRGDFRPAEQAERNFCQRCGKRSGDAMHIHTCTPPAEKAERPPRTKENTMVDITVAEYEAKHGAEQPLSDEQILNIWYQPNIFEALQVARTLLAAKGEKP